MNTIIVNGSRIEVPDGASVCVDNGMITVNGREAASGLSGIVKIVVEGTIGKLDTKANVEVHGDVMGDVDAGGNVACGNVVGSIDCGGNVDCVQVQGAISCGGNLVCRK